MRLPRSFQARLGLSLGLVLALLCGLTHGGSIAW